MEAHLAKSPPDYAKAKAIYEKGGNSGATATLTVAALAKAVAKGAEVVQGSAKGKAKKAAAVGAKELLVSVTSTCKVGGLSAPDASECFTTAAAVTAGGVDI